MLASFAIKQKEERTKETSDKGMEADIKSVKAHFEELKLRHDGPFRDLRPCPKNVDYQSHKRAFV